MYDIYADDTLIYSDVSPLESVKVVNPKLTLADSAAGELEMTLPPINVGYESIQRMVTDITIKCDDVWLWSGRVLTDSYDFWNNRKMVCEGELAFLNDSIQPPAKYNVDTTTIETFFESLISIHNQQVGENRQFKKGMVTVKDGDQQDDDDAINRFTNYETTLECMNEKLVGRLGGHLRIRHVNGERLLDYITDDDLETNSQTIQFGVNLLDFSKNIDMSELATAIVPRGNRLEDESAVEVEGLEPYLTVKNVGVKEETIEVEGEQVTEVWHEANSIFVKNPTAVRNFGWICAVVDWDQVSVDQNLYTKAAKYLKDEQYEKMVLEIKAVDLKYLDIDVQSIRFLSKLHCVSEPHGMDHTFTVSKVEFDLANPNNNYYTLGDDIQLSLTQSTSKVNSEITEKINAMPSKGEILKAAQRNAYQMIMGKDGSYVHLIPGSDGGIKRIEVTDGPTYDPDADDDDSSATDPFPDSLNRWIWTVGGLGHIGRETYQDAWEDIALMNVAMTMDGSIVADYITTGILKVDGKYSINTETGAINMREGIFGPWRLNADGFTDGGDAWIKAREISCGQHGGTLVKMDGRSSGDSGGYLSVEVNENSDYVHVHYNYISRSDGQQVEWDGGGSDERLKKNIEDLTIEEALTLIMNVEPLTFRYKKDDKVKHYGVTAQRMEMECEELGLENPFVEQRDDEYKTVKYTQFITPLIKVVQEQQKEIERLKEVTNK